MLTRRLDELLLAEGLVDEQSLSLARTEALSRQRKLAEIVIDLGLIDQRSLALLLARESGAELVSPIDSRTSMSVSALIPAHVARHHQVVPVRAEHDGLVVAMIDPFEPAIVELLEAAAGVRVRRAVGVRSEIEMAVLELYHVEDLADSTIQITPNLALALGASLQPIDDEFSGLPDDWSTTIDEAAKAAALPSSGPPAHDPGDADRTAPSTAGSLTEAERLAHVERQLLSVSRMLAIIQSRLDTIDARLAHLGSQPRVTR
jgi:hypothetical protein